MQDQSTPEPLKRGLKNRHIQLIALGGAVGTGLFLGIAQTIQLAGPAVLLGYAIAGLMAFSSCANWERWWSRSLSPAASATSPTSTGASSPGSFPVGTTGWCTCWSAWPNSLPWVSMCSTGGRGSRPGPRRRSFRGDQPDQPHPGEGLWRNGVLVRLGQGGSDRQHDRFRRLDARQWPRRPGCQRGQPVAIRRVLFPMA